MRTTALTHQIGTNMALQPDANTSVVMVSYRTGAILLDSIKSVLEQEGLKELIIVDHDNPEDTREKLDSIAAQHSHISIIRGQGNIGFAAGCNLGVKAASGIYIVLLNPDCVLQDKTTLTQLVGEFSRYPQAWLVGCRMVDETGAPYPTNIRNILTPRIALCSFLHLDRYFKLPGINLPEEPDDDKPRLVPAISGALMCMKRERYHKMKGLDERYFLHVEDLDLCMRIQRSGGKVMYIPTLSVLHQKSSSNVSSVLVEQYKTDSLLHYFHHYFRYPWWEYSVISSLLYIRKCLLWFSGCFSLSKG